MKTIKNLKAEEIRKSILQLAIQGKLVKQDPTDEPASELVKKIYVEKEKLIKEGKIKKDKNKSYIFKGDDNCYYEKIGDSEPIKLDDLPFDIPDHWTWIRLGKLCKLVGTGIEYYQGKKFYYSTGSIKGDTFIPEGEYEYEKRPSRANRIASVGELIDAKMKGTIKVQVVDERLSNSLLSTGFYVLKNYLSNIEYIKYLICSDYYQSEKDKRCTGTTQKAITDEELSLIYIPLPPLNEQKRVVNKIQILNTILDYYNQIEINLSKLECEFPQKLKKSILQYAIEGKLVKQDPNDEPASVLLERIKVEKERLIKDGKIKRDKNESYIYQGDDKNYYEKISNYASFIHTPFLIPSTWSWIRFSNLVNFTLGKTPERNNPIYWNDGIYPWFSIADMKDKKIVTETKEKISECSLSKYFNSCTSPAGTLIMSFKLTIGRVSILGVDAIHNEAIISIFPFLEENNTIRDWLFDTLGLIVEYVDQTDAIKGSTLNKEKINSMLIPLPPILEQKRIIEKIDSINKIIGC